MYRFPVRNLEGDASNIVYIHPTYTDFGVGFRVERQTEETFVRCDVVTGDINGKQQLRALEDFSAPLDVMLWALNAMRIIQNNTVNTTSIDIPDLFANHVVKLIYTAASAAPAASQAEPEPQQAEQEDSENTDQESTS